MRILVAGLTLLSLMLCASVVTPQRTVSPDDQRITDIAANSDCTKHRWNQRGRAPVGYIKGMALTYAKSFCESRGSAGPATTAMKQPLVRGEDALVRYRDDLAQNGIDVSSDIERLRALYTVLEEYISGQAQPSRDQNVTGIFKTAYRERP